MKEKQIAYCGIVCTDCDVYIATQKNDNKMRKKVAEEWTKRYNHNLKPEDINCDGCLAVTGKIVGGYYICPIRKCGKEKGIINCAYCATYPCVKLDGLFKDAPIAKKNLDSIKQGVR